jgi:hypothetical protein
MSHAPLDRSQGKSRSALRDGLGMRGVKAQRGAWR